MPQRRPAPRPAPRRFALLAVTLLAASPRAAAVEDPPEPAAVIAKHHSFQECMARISRHPGQAVWPREAAFRGSVQTMLAWAPPAAAVAVFFARSTEDVAAAAACASRFNIKISPAAGRHGLTGAAVVDDRLIIDVSNMTSLELVPHAGSGPHEHDLAVRVGAGNTGAVVYSFVADKGPPDAVMNLGGGTWVGVAGLVLGGGYGPVSRFYGYSSDSLLEVEVVLANGTVVTANEHTNPDLYWACAGSGGGQFGIATQLLLRVHKLPGSGETTNVALAWAAGAEATVSAFMQFQALLPSLDKRWALDVIRLGNGGVGPKFTLNGQFLGPVTEAVAQLRANGLIDDALMDKGFSSSSDSASPDVQAFIAQHPHGVRLDVIPRGRFYDTAIVQNLAPVYTSNASSPFYYCCLPPEWASGGWTGSPSQAAFLAGLMRGGGPSSGPQVVGGLNYRSGFYTMRQRLVGVLSREAVGVVVDALVHAASECHGDGPQFCSLVVGNHLLGGALNEQPPRPSSVPWRDGRLLLLSYGAYPAVASKAAAGTPQAIASLEAAAQAMLDRLTPLLPDQPPAAYLNYQMSQPGPDWRQLYFGSTYERLQHVKRRYDPRGLLTKPYGVQA